jgi:AmmeMemoRadiSam system protein B
MEQMQKLCRILLGLLVGFIFCTFANAGDPFPPLYEDKGVFISAIRRNQIAALSQRITGITVPHHLIAADLIAEAFGLASRGNYSRIVILSPDHFRRSKTPFSVTRKDFRTVLGSVNTDRAAVEELLQSALVSESELFSHEHGVQALLPFIAHHFPDSKVVPVAIRINSKPQEWQSFADAFVRLVTPETLIVQSTDFSHFLPHREAAKKDQETLRVLSVANPDLVRSLKQPEHLDSQAAQYLQLCLQKEVFGARPTVWANRNSQQYTPEPLRKTTSYIVQIYSPEFLSLETSERYVFAGDTFFGRYMARFLAHEERRRKLIGAVFQATRGAKLIVNLEGAVMGKCPDKLGRYELCMETDLTLTLLKKLHVAAVSVANNHSKDQGPEAYSKMVKLLTDSGIRPLENGSVTEFDKFRVAAFTDVDNSKEQKYGVLRETDLNALDNIPHDKPIFAFIHWGKEYSCKLGDREKDLRAKLHGKGVELVVGCHSHRSGDLLCQRENCSFFSLGNFIFDQRGPRVSGKLLEISFFPQGTYFLRPIEIDNYYAGRQRH